MKSCKQLGIIVLFLAISLTAFSQTPTKIRLYCGPQKITAHPLWVIVLKRKCYVLNNSSIKLIDPKMVENINVYNDATATAIYGKQAADGVIAVTIMKKESRKEYRRLKPYLSKL